MIHRADEFTGQARVVIAHLNRGWPLTDAQARKKYGIARLADVVYKLRRRRVQIMTELIQVPARLGRGGGTATVAKYTRPGVRRGGAH